jgi:hypothetical protein
LKASELTTSGRYMASSGRSENVRSVEQEAGQNPLPRLPAWTRPITRAMAATAMAKCLFAMVHGLMGRGGYKKPAVSKRWRVAMVGHEKQTIVHRTG